MWWHAKAVAAAAEIRSQSATAFVESADWLRRHYRSALATISGVKDHAQPDKTEHDDPTG
jgi:hypothetical protein